MNVEGNTIILVSLNPGATKTDRELSEMPGFVCSTAKLFFSTPEKAALTSFSAATAFDVRDHKAPYAGKFLNGPGKVKKPSERTGSANLPKSLWNLTKLLWKRSVLSGAGGVQLRRGLDNRTSGYISSIPPDI